LHVAEIVDTEGERIGEVEAVEMVTLGQRRGVGGGGGTKRFVVDVDVPGRRVVVGPETMLLTESEVVGQVSWSSSVVSGTVRVQCSAHGEANLAVVESDGDDNVVVRWREPQRRISPGQSAVFYDEAGDVVLGGGVVISPKVRPGLEGHTVIDFT
jgi:tRNA-specific 2-thiouridylase